MMLWTYRTLLHLLEPDKRRRFWFIVALMMLMSLLDLAGVAMIVPFLSVLADPEIIQRQRLLTLVYDTLGFSSTYTFLQFLGVTTFILVMSGIAVRAVGFYMANLFARQVNVDFGMARLERFLSQPYEWFLQQHSADLSKSVLQEVTDIVQGSVQPAFRIVANVVLLLLLCGLLLVIEPLGATVIGVLFGTSFWLIDRTVRRQIDEMGRDRRRANRERHQATGESLTGIKEVKIMALEATYLRRFVAPSQRLANYQARISLIGEMPRFALEAMTFGGMLIFTLWLLWTNEGVLDQIVPVLGAFAFAALRLMPTAQILFRDISVMRFSRAGLQGLYADLGMPVEVDRATVDGEIVPMSFEQALRFEGASFTYPGVDRSALHDVTMEIEAGQTVGLVGPTGAGKSTVIDLLLGLVSPTGGQITVDGVTLEPRNRRSWQAQVGFVPQAIHLVDDTIAANIATGLSPDEIDMERVREAARLAQVDTFVQGFEQGYETFVGDAGMRLSGGQKQRVGIARALYRDRKVLIFDEATSALDTVTEREVVDAIRGLHGTRTLVLVSHRLSTLSHCDRIFMLKEGQIVDEGRYEDLRAKNEDFREMLAAQ